MERFICSQKFHDQLKRALSLIGGRDIYGPISKMQGIPLHVSPHFPLKEPDKTRPPISRDRFCEYDESDMEWAEPLGLASWHQKETHCVKINAPEFVTGLSFPTFDRSLDASLPFPFKCGV